VRMAQFRWVGVLAAIALVAISSIGPRLSDPEEQRFQVVNGVVGEPVKVNNGEVTVTQLRVGTILKQFGQIQDGTDGMFMVIRVTGAATGPKPLELNAARLLSGDFRYEGYQSSSGVMLNQDSKPQLTLSLRWLRPTSTTSPWRSGRTRSSGDISSAYASSLVLRQQTPSSGVQPLKASSSP
jgi:hypothetical protein